MSFSQRILSGLFRVKPVERVIGPMEFTHVAVRPKRPPTAAELERLKVKHRTEDPWDRIAVSSGRRVTRG